MDCRLLALRMPRIMASRTSSLRCARANGAPSPAAEHEELVFDSETGELQAAGNVEAEDRVPATQMAREGFF